MVISALTMKKSIARRRRLLLFRMTRPKNFEPVSLYEFAPKCYSLRVEGELPPASAFVGVNEKNLA